MAYLDRGWTGREQRKQRELHAANDRVLQAHKDEKAAMLKRREVNRQRRQERHAIEVLGRAALEKLLASGGDSDTIIAKAIQGNTGAGS